MIRKIHLGKCLMMDDWGAVRKDLSLRPVEGVDGTATTGAILTVLSKYGIYPDYVELWGTGKPLREFLWSEEMADASVYILEHVDFSDVKGGNSEVRNCHINIGTGKEITIAALAHRIREVVGYEGEIRFNADKPDGTMRKLTDVSKLHALGWHHKIEIEEGVQKMYDWYIADHTVCFVKIVLPNIIKSPERTQSFWAFLYLILLQNMAWLKIKRIYFKPAFRNVFC